MESGVETEADYNSGGSCNTGLGAPYAVKVRPEGSCGVLAILTT